jgi:sugar lactone lactonase YvrE
MKFITDRQIKSILIIAMIILTIINIPIVNAENTVSGYIFVDSNLNSIKDSSESGKGSVSITLSGTDSNGNSISLTTTSKSSGYYSFSVPNGNYMVSVTLPTNWGNTTPLTISLSVSSSLSNINFGMVKLGQISAQLFNDKNGNGVKDSDESYKSGSFSLSGTLINGSNVNTSASGNPAKFSKLFPGLYNVTALPVNGYVFTTSQTLTFNINGNTTQGLFGIKNAINTITVQGYVYYDTNQNGVKNNDENGLSNWSVYLKDSNGNLLSSKYTDSNGFYSFSISPGVYYKISTDRNGYNFTIPTSGEYSINTTSSITRNFGLVDNFDPLAGLGDIVVFYTNDIRIQNNLLITNVKNYLKVFYLNGTLNTFDNEDSTIGGFTLDHDNNKIITLDDRVIKIDPNGNLIFTRKITNATSGYIKLSGVDVDSNNNIYVASKFDHKILVLDPNGNLIMTISSPGLSEGYLKLPFDVELDSNNRVLVANTGNNRIDIFDANGNFIKSIGTFGKNNGQFNKPRSIAVDQYDNIYVADTYNNRIQKFDKNGNFIMSFGKLGSDPGEFGNPSGIEVDTNGIIYVYDLSNDRIQKFDANGNYIGEFLFADPYIEPYFVYVDNTSNRAYISDGHRHKIIIVNATTGEFIHEFGELGDLLGEFQGPRGIAIDNNYIYVADNYNARIQKFDKNGNFIMSFGAFGSGNNAFKQPRGIVLYDNKLYIADTDNNRIKITDIDGNYIGSISSTTPYQIALDNNGFIYAAEFSINRVAKYDTNGVNIMNIDGLNQPKGVYVKDNVIYISDSGNNKIKTYDMSGNLLSSFGSRGIGPGQFINIRGIFVDNNGRIWVADGDANRVQVFNNNGTLQMIIDYNSLFN